MSSTARITVEEIANRLSLGRLAIYALLQQGQIPLSVSGGAG